MKNIIATIIISVVILGLTMIGIELWRNNLELMKLTAAKTTELEKLQKTSITPLEKEQLTGGEVISLIRYYSKDPDVAVEVSIEGASKVYIGDSYRQEDFYISFEALFEKTTMYEGKKLKKLIFEKTQ